MSQSFEAIYEGGVLRPLTPLNLPDTTRVSGIFQIKSAASVGHAADSAELRRQQEALDAMLEAVDNLPQTPHHDKLSGRDHDQILYGARP